MEETSIKRIAQCHPKVREKFLAAYNEAVKVTPIGVHPFVTQAMRTFAESDALYALGRTKVNPDGKSSKKPLGNIVSNAKAGQSYHNYGLAIDFVNQVNGDAKWDVDANWMKVVAVFKKHGFSWGGDWKTFKDYPHFEYTFGLSVSQLKAKWDRGDTFQQDGYTYVNI